MIVTPMKIPNFIKSILVGIPIGITFFDSVGYIARVDGISMQPALNPERDVTDYVYLNRWAIRDLDIKRGEIISLISPKNPNQKIIKRVVGIQGDIIITRGYKTQVVRVPEGHCWVEGDHVGHSMDSNSFGPISLGLITARASCIVWPPSRWQSIESTLPDERKPLNLKQFDFTGPVLRNGLTLGDVDNDGNNELVVGNEEGDLCIFKGGECWQTINGLGFIACVVIGDVLNIKENCLVIISADGWCHIYYTEKKKYSQTNIAADVDACSFSSQTDTNDEESKPLLASEENEFLECVHKQRIPANSKVALLGDIDNDGVIELVLGLTDRVVRSYRWVDIPLLQEPLEPNNTLGSVVKTIRGKLVGLNKWECANQIGSVTLHHSADGSPCLLVAQPGGTFMRIKCQTEGAYEPITENFDASESHSIRSESFAASFVDYQFLGLSRMRNQNISTEILGDLNTQESIKLDAKTSESESSSQKSESETSENKKSAGQPYAVATLDGTIMLVQDEIILWAIQVDHQTFALSKLDVTGNGCDDIIVCSWDGQTYILDQEKNSVRFQLDEPVQAFCTGHYTLIPGEKPLPCLVYVTFWNKIFLYYDIHIKNMTIKRFNPDLSTLEGVEKLLEDTNAKEATRKTKREVVEYLLYGVKSKSK